MSGKPTSKAKGPSFKEQIKGAILALKDRTGSSLPAIKKFLSATPAQYRFINAALKSGVAAGFFVKNKGSYKLSKAAKAGRAYGCHDQSWQEGDHRCASGDA